MVAPDGAEEGSRRWVRARALPHGESLLCPLSPTWPATATYLRCGCPELALEESHLHLDTHRFREAERRRQGQGSVFGEGVVGGKREGEKK